MEKRPINQIASEIKAIWSKQGKGVNYAAKPYLDALLQLLQPSDKYFAEEGKTIALYFLSNASTFKGEEAKRLKTELKAAYNIK